MPIMDGIEMVMEIRKLDNNVPIVCTSQQQEDYDIEKLFEVGSNDFLPKPFTIKDIKNKFQKYLG